MKRSAESDLYNAYWFPSEVWWLILSFLPMDTQLFKIPLVSTTWASIIEKEVTTFDKVDYSGHDETFSLDDFVLRRVPNLRSLRLFNDDEVSLSGLQLFKGLTKLVIRGIDTLHCDDLLTLTGLVELSTRGNYHIPNAKNLRSLSLGLNNIVSRETLLRLPALMKLKLRAFRGLTTDDLPYFTALESLVICLPHLCDDAIKGLTNLTRLDTLQMSGMLTDAGISRLTNLKILSICNVSAQFTGACLHHLPALTSLFAWHENLTAVQLSLLTTLEDLKWRKCTQSELICLTKLRKLRLTQPLYASKELFTSLPHLRKLKAPLYLHPSVTPNDLPCFTNEDNPLGSFKTTWLSIEDFTLIHTL